MPRIHLISSPRNLSTALMYSFAQRSDMHVVDEPLYAYYLNLTGKDHPGKREIMESQSTSWESVWEEMVNRNYPKPHVFFKGMAHHLVGIDWNRLEDFTSILYLRNPKQLIASFAKVIDNPTMQDIGVQLQYDIFHFLKERGKIPIVLDSGTMLSDPPRVLEKLCNALGIPFEASMLSWQPGPRKEDGVWAPHWYSNVHTSTGFQAQATSSRPLPEYLYPLYEACLPLYQEMTAFAIDAT